MDIKGTIESVKDTATKAAKQVQEVGGELVDQARPLGHSALETIRQAAGMVMQKGEEFVKTSEGKKIAAGAAGGAAIGVPVPFIGPISGALIGGLIGWWMGRDDAEAASELERRCRSLTPTQRKEELETLQKMFEDGDISEERYREGRNALTGKR